MERCLNFANNGNPAPDRRVEKKIVNGDNNYQKKNFTLQEKKGTEARFS